MWGILLTLLILYLNTPRDFFWGDFFVHLLAINQCPFILGLWCILSKKGNKFVFINDGENREAFHPSDEICVTKRQQEPSHSAAPNTLQSHFIHQCQPWTVLSRDSIIIFMKCNWMVFVKWQNWSSVLQEFFLFSCSQLSHLINNLFPSGHCPGQPALGVPAGALGLGQETSRGPFQPQPWCDWQCWCLGWKVTSGCTVGLWHPSCTTERDAVGFHRYQNAHSVLAGFLVWRWWHRLWHSADSRAGGQTVLLSAVGNGQLKE